MALIDVVKCDMIDGEFCQKYPSDNIKLGSQLVVYPAQTAFFVKGGAVFDEFTSGTYTIKTENIPLLNMFINLPFGGRSPFKAEVWFINRISKLDIPWGTPHQIQIEDPKYKIIIPVRAHGQYGVKISNPRSFLESLIGNLTSFTSDKIESYLKGRVISSMNTILAQQIIDRQVSVFDINTQLMTLSSDCNQKLNLIFEKYGVEIVEFSIMSITVSQDDKSIIRLKEAKDLMAKLDITGRDNYQMQRSFDILEKAAGNEGAGGQMAAMGIGLGAGVGLGNTMSNSMGQIMNINPTPTPPPIPQSKVYYLVINGVQVPNQNITQISELIKQGTVNSDTLVWTVGMDNWMRLNDIPELSSLVVSQTPPSINNSK